MYITEMDENKLNTPESKVTMHQANGCWSQCKSAYHKFMDTKPTVKPTDPKARLWHKRAKCSWFAYISPFLGIIVYFADIIMDSWVAYKHYNAGDYKWCELSVLIIVTSSCIVNSIFAINLWDDKKHRQNIVDLMEETLDIKTTKLTYILHLLQLGPVVRFLRILKTVRKVRNLDEDKEMNKTTKIHIQRLLIDQQLDSSLLGVFVAFLEDAPQLLLQLYILVLEPEKHSDWTFQDILIVINIFKSLALFSYSLVSFAKDLHLSCAETSPLPMCASVGLFVWRFFMLISRVVALVLFASVFEIWFFRVIGIHLIVSLVLLIPQECGYFKESKGKRIVLKLAITYVHVFCFFPLEGSDTGKYGFPYYAFTFTENVLITFVWCLFTDYGMVFITVAVSVEGVAFVIGLMAMTVYYRLPLFCHPLRPPPLKVSRLNDPLLFESEV